MRITNQMITNDVMSGINKNLNNLSTLEQQYYSGKKIQRPSEDPIIAVRALKLRTNLSELNQYYEKNIPDAKNWMDLTEGALTDINSILKSINTACVQGANDDLNAENRDSIAKNLEQYKEQIYQEGNTNYAGRYVFSGYKTDKSLIFDEATSDYQYTITEKFAVTDIDTVSKVKGAYSVTDFSPTNDYSTSPELIEAYRIRLSYDELDSLQHDGKTSVTMSGLPEGTVINTKKTSDGDAYTPEANSVNFIPETGELILSKETYEALIKNGSDITVGYSKTNFEKGDLRPEHYFNCTAYALDGSGKEITYVKENQEIQYEINFNQKLTINTQGSDAITHSIGREIDEIIAAVEDVQATEAKIEEVEKMLADSNNANDTEKLSKLNQLKEQLEKELTLKNSIMQKKFGNGITASANAQDKINVALADLGSRSVRLELTENRLSDLQVEFTELMSNNEDVDIVETYVKLNSAQMIYNASLGAAAKVVQNSLLDFL
ncbi:MAG: Flagellin [Lachnoclostridium sp.]